MSDIDKVMRLSKDHEIKFVDLRFTDTLGKQQHISVPGRLLDSELFELGKMFDGSSIRGWQKIHKSDMALRPDPATAVFDPFAQDPTLIMVCDVLEPASMRGYDRCPRSLARRAEEYLKTTGIADTAYFGPEPEFFIFDDVRWSVGMQGSFYQVDSKEAAWNSGQSYPEGNMGHRPAVKGGYFPVSPVDSSHDLRSEMSLYLEQMGTLVEAHHHEVATANQVEIATRFDSLVNKADQVQTLKYVAHNVAHAHGKTVTFMAKPLVGDNGSGMHCHQSLSKDGNNIFAGDEYAGLSQEALYYIGGIIKHARALNAFANPGTNSYKRLVPGFEAPVLLAYSARNRSASIRIPYVANSKGRRIEVRFPDPTANPYLLFSALMMAGIDGIKNKIDPGAAVDKDLYELPPEELKDIPTVCSSLEEALASLQQDHAFLLQGDVFTKDFIDSYIKLKEEEVTRLRLSTHPVEFELYYSA